MKQCVHTHMAHLTKHYQAHNGQTATCPPAKAAQIALPRKHNNRYRLQRRFYCHSLPIALAIDSPHHMQSSKGLDTFLLTVKEKGWLCL